MRAWLFALAALACVSVRPAHADTDEDFRAARAAFEARNGARLAQLAPRLQDHVLAPFVRYWQLSLNLEQTPHETVLTALAELSDSFVSDRLRAEWLKLLGRRQDWGAFTAEYPRLINEDWEITCYALQARLALLPQDDGALEEAHRLWFNGNDLPSSCDPLFAELARRDRLSVDDVYARLRLALEAGKLSVARRVVQYLPATEQAALGALEAAANNPQQFLDRRGENLASRGARETTLFAVHRLARSEPDAAIQRWNVLRERFSAAEQAYVDGQIALHLARRHDPRALDWFTRADAAPLSPAQLIWKTRSALRAQAWPTVAATIERMDAAEQRKAEWRYWRARALRAMGKAIAAEELLAQLSREHDFYGQLAGEELGAAIGPVAVPYKATEAEVAAMAAHPTLRRALALYRLNMRGDGLREWNWGIRGFDDKALLAAAELARRNEVYDRAIHTADRTRQLHDFSLRFPAPHREVVRRYAQPLALDDAWVFGLVRQESRFVPVAKSSVGASGLMQLMPATARWVARQIGLQGFSLNALHDIETNIALGTYYLKHVLDLFDGSPVLATAAYNAGPGRARRWQDVKPLEAAAYIESIPFEETRDYVKKVMSNSVHYARRFEDPLTSLRQRLGTVPARRGNERPLGDTP